MTARRGLPTPALLALAFGALTLAACDGASPAGGDLIGEGGDPVVDTLAVGTLSVVEVADVSAGSALGSQPTQRRLLAGRAIDPTFGDVTATAYVDFARPALPENFAGRTPSAVSLIVPVSAYTYGDPAASVTLGVAEVTGEWAADPDSLVAGQAIEVDAPFTTFTVPAAVDSVGSVTVPLSSSWVVTNDSLLTGSNYVSRFEGLAFVPQEGAAAVRGLNASGIRLRVFVDGDSLDYFAAEVYTRVETTPPTGTAVRDGSGRALQLNLPLGADSLRNSALSQARLVVRLDTVALQADGITRPVPEQLSLVGVREDSTRAVISSAAVASGEVAFTGTTITRLIQDTIFGSPLFERYDVIVPASPVTVDVAPYTSADLVLVRVPPVE